MPSPQQAAPPVNDPNNPANAYLNPGVTNPWPTMTGPPGPTSSLASNGEQLSGRGSFYTPIDRGAGSNGEELTGRGSFAPDPVPAAPPTGPNAMTPAMQQYVNQFQKSQAAQQQAINAGLVQALAGLGQRRDAAAKVASTLPGEFNKTYAEATGNQQQQATIAANAFGHSTEGGNADQALISSSNAAQRGAGLGAQPLLEAGIAADYSKGATALNNTHMQNEASVDQQQQQFDMTMLQNQMQRDATVADRTAGYKHDQAMTQLQSDLALRNAVAEGKGGATAAQDAKVLAGTAGAIPDYATLTKIVGTPDYQNALATIRGQASYGAKAGDWKNVVKVLNSHGQVGSAVLNALIYTGAITGDQVSSVK